MTVEDAAFQKMHSCMKSKSETTDDGLNVYGISLERTDLVEAVGIILVVLIDGHVFSCCISDEAGTSVYHATCTFQFATEILVDLFTFFNMN